MKWLVVCLLVCIAVAAPAQMLHWIEDDAVNFYSVRPNNLGMPFGGFPATEATPMPDGSWTHAAPPGCVPGNCRLIACNQGVCATPSNNWPTPIRTPTPTVVSALRPAAAVILP